MSNIVRLIDHTPQSENYYFFDCNVWVFLFFPMLNHKQDKQSAYARLLRDIRAAKATIVVNSLVLSELSNVWLRYCFQVWQQQHSNRGHLKYKRDYVGTVDYKRNVDRVKQVIKDEILPMTTFWSDRIETTGLDLIWQNFGLCDFNDSCYLNMVHDNAKCILVTDDGDFQDQSIIHNGTIVSMNLRH